GLGRSSRRSPRPSAPPWHPSCRRAEGPDDLYYSKLAPHRVDGLLHGHRTSAKDSPSSLTGIERRGNLPGRQAKSRPDGHRLGPRRPPSPSPRRLASSDRGGGRGKKLGWQKLLEQAFRTPILRGHG